VEVVAAEVVAAAAEVVAEAAVVAPDTIHPPTESTLTDTDRAAEVAEAEVARCYKWPAYSYSTAGMAQTCSQRA
jgi:hypothetical protein